MATIFFDWGNVIGDFDHSASCHLWADTCQMDEKELHNQLINSEAHLAFESGQADENDFAQTLATILTEPRITKDKDLLKWAWQEAIVCENPGMEKILKAVTFGQHRLFLLSNTDPWHWEAIEKLPLVRKYFPDPDCQVLSFREGCRKPDYRFFRTAIRKSGEDIRNIIYIDDRPDFVEFFTQLGGRGICFDYRKDQLSDLKKKLIKLNIISH